MMDEFTLTYEEMEAERDQWRQAWYSLEKDHERLKAESEFNRKEHVAHLNEIWSYITDGLGDWEYPGQIMRRAKEVVEELRKLRSQEFNRVYNQWSDDTEWCRKCNMVKTNHVSAMCEDCRKKLERDAIK